MSNIQKSSNNLRLNSKLQLEKLMFNFEDGEFESIELVISIKDEGVNIKEFSSYLDFIYRIDGNLGKTKFLSYSKLPRVQLEISRFKQGSLEIIIEKILGTVDAQNLITIYLVLKYFPRVVSATLDGIHKIYEVLNAREDYLEKKGKRKENITLHKVINEDKGLEHLDKNDKDKIIKLISRFYEKPNMPASRFAHKYIKSIELKPKRRN
jgi:hypothetical protein